MTDQSISPLRRRMIEDMTIRKLAPTTQASYIRAVRNFTVFFGHSPDRATAEDLRRYQLHLASSGTSGPGINATVTALRFFFTVTLGRGAVTKTLTSVREPRKLPVVLSTEEVARLLDAAPGLKYKAALSVAYGAGLRAAEVMSLYPFVLNLEHDLNTVCYRFKHYRLRHERGAKDPTQMEWLA